MNTNVLCSDPDHLTTDCTDDTDERDKIRRRRSEVRRWWIRISCAARWSAATWRRFPHTTRNTQAPGFASRDHYKVNGYILTSSAVVGIDDAGVIAAVSNRRLVDHRSRLQQRQ